MKPQDCKEKETGPSSLGSLPLPSSYPFLPRQAGLISGKGPSLPPPRVPMEKGVLRKLFFEAQTLISPPTCPFTASSE